ncbi:MAG: hypothetical protein M3483_06090 [Gemmatimonadota bacterium]|jgi:hypothetical protein|nr:hypothetical protein [Gemmatimonadota bacterium]
MSFQTSSISSTAPDRETIQSVRFEIDLPARVAGAVERLQAEDPRLLGRALQHLVLRKEIFDLLRGSPELNGGNILTHGL